MQYYIQCLSCCMQKSLILIWKYWHVACMVYVWCSINKIWHLGQNHTSLVLKSPDPLMKVLTLVQNILCYIFLSDYMHNVCISPSTDIGYSFLSFDVLNIRTQGDPAIMSSFYLINIVLSVQWMEKYNIFQKLLFVLGLKIMIAKRLDLSWKPC